MGVVYNFGEIFGDEFEIEFTTDELLESAQKFGFAVDNDEEIVNKFAGYRFFENAYEGKFIRANKEYRELGVIEGRAKIVKDVSTLLVRGYEQYVDALFDDYKGMSEGFFDISDTKRALDRLYEFDYTTTDIFFAYNYSDKFNKTNEVYRANSSLIEFLIFSMNPNFYITPFVFRGKIDTLYKLRTGKVFYEFIRSAEYAYIPRNAKMYTVYFDFDIYDKETGEIIPKLKENMFAFLYFLKEEFGNLFIRYSRSGTNMHALLILDAGSISPSYKTYVRRSINKLIKSLGVKYGLPYDIKIYDDARLIFNSKYPFIPVKFEELTDAKNFVNRYYKVVENYAKLHRVSVSSESVKRDAMNAVKSAPSNVERKRNKKLDMEIKRAGQAFKLAQLRKKLGYCDVYKKIKNGNEKLTARDIQKAVSKFKSFYKNVKGRYDFIDVVSLIIDYFGIPINIYEDYIQFSLSPYENTPYDCYLYRKDVRYFKLQSENSIRHLREDIVFVKITKREKTFLIPYSYFKNNKDKILKEINSFESLEYVVPNMYFDELISDIIKNYAGIDVEISIKHVFVGKAPRRHVLILNKIINELKNENLSVIDLKRYGSKTDRSRMGLNDLMKFIKDLEKETRYFKVIRETKYSFIVKINCEKARALLMTLLEFLKDPLHSTDVISKIKSNEVIDIVYIEAFVERVIRRVRVPYVLTSLGYNVKIIYELFKEFRKGNMNLSKLVSKYKYLVYETLILAFLYKDNVIRLFDDNTKLKSALLPLIKNRVEKIA